MGSSTHRALTGAGEFLNVSAQSGTILDRWENALTLTDMEVHKEAEIRAMQFNGLTSRVDCGVPDDLTGDFTTSSWVKPYSFGGQGLGTVINNGKFGIAIYDASPRIAVASDGSTTAFSANDIIVLNTWMHIVTTRTSTGVTNIYFNGVLSGIADQDSGTPVAGTTNLLIGNNDAGTREWYGLIEPVRIFDGILTTEQISQLFTSTRNKYFI